MADRYYVSFPLAPGEVVLQGPEAHHLANVLRAEPGAVVTLFSGDGAEYPASVTSATKKSVALSVGHPQYPQRELPFLVEAAVALPKGDRADYVIERLNELGVTRFVPIRTRRSVAHPKRERLERSVIESCKQCGRNKLMHIADAMEWETYCRPSGSWQWQLLAHNQSVDATSIDGFLEQDRRLRNGNIRFAIGPEGGFTPDEAELAVAIGWKTISLGPRILRVETAATALAAIVALARAPLASRS